jgi:DNA-binding MarR family transcriptional regulator
MRKIKLSGREVAVVQCIDDTSSTPGLEIRERTHMDIEDLVEIANSLLDAGFVETLPPSDRVTAEKFDATLFEINPAYTHELRVATRR